MWVFLEGEWSPQIDFSFPFIFNDFGLCHNNSIIPHKYSIFLIKYSTMRLLRNIFVAQKNIFAVCLENILARIGLTMKRSKMQRYPSSIFVLNFSYNVKLITWNKLRKVLPIIAGVLTIIAKVHSIVVPNHVLPKMPI